MARGFTLIELLVVIAIISLLMAILVPSLSRAKDLVRAVVCAGNQRSIGVAMHFYAQDYEQVLPRGLAYEGQNYLDRWWYVGLGRYLGLDRVVSHDGVTWEEWRQAVESGTSYWCPADPLPAGGGEHSIKPTSYGALTNTWCVSWKPRTSYGPSDHPEVCWNQGYSMNMVYAKASEACMLVDMCYNWYYAWAQSDVPGTKSKIAHAPPDLLYYPGTGYSHLGDVNGLFLDGHASRQYLLPSPYSQANFFDSYWSYADMRDLLTVPPNFYMGPGGSVGQYRVLR